MANFGDISSNLVIPANSIFIRNESDDSFISFIPVSKTYTDIIDTSLYIINQLTYALNTSIGDYATVTQLNSMFQSKIDLSTKTSSDEGIMGEITFDASYIYVCTSTNIWGRLLLETGY